MNRNSSFRNQMYNEATQKGQEQKGLSYIGKVVNYHGVTGTAKKAGPCDCDRHKGKKMKLSERHSVDVDVLIENKVQRFNSVPCFIYAQGVIDKGFVKNDRVYINFINGDSQMPIATAYYREPDGLTIFWQNLKHRVGNYVLEMLPSMKEVTGGDK